MKLSPLKTVAARFGLAPAVLLLSCPAFAQGKPAPVPQRQSAPAVPAAPAIRVPDQLASVKLLASMITAIDHANKTGNYAVLLALGSAGFQASNSPASLGVAFGIFRQQRIDLSDVLVLSPTYDIPPVLVAPGLVRMRGRFPLARGPLIFDIQFRWDRGWRLESVALVPPASLAPSPASPGPRPAPPSPTR